MACLLRGIGIVAVVLGSGCGPAVSVEQGSPSSSTSSSTDAQTGTQTSSLSDGSTGEDTGVDCEAYFDEPVDTEVTTIEIRNDGDEAVLLPVSCGNDYLSMISEQGWTYPGPWCGDTCQSRIEYGCQVCDGCASGAFRRIEAGARYQLTWHGFLYEDVTPPVSCLLDESCGSSCQRARAPQPGDLVDITIIAASIADCEASVDDPAACSCKPSGEGWCDVYASELTPIELQVTATFDPSTGEPPVVVFQ